MNIRTFHKIVLVTTMAIGTAVANAEVVVIVNAKNPINTLTNEQVSDMFIAKNLTFPDGSRATLLDQAAGSDRTSFYSKVVGRSDAQVKAAWARVTFTGKGTPPKELKNDQEVKAFVASNSEAIGYVDKSVVDGSVKVVLSVP